jgi:hypothetical protein
MIPTKREQPAQIVFLFVIRVLDQLPTDAFFRRIFVLEVVLNLAILSNISKVLVSLLCTRHVKDARAEGKESLFWGWVGMAKTETAFLPRL